jgi:hypothetical protein
VKELFAGRDAIAHGFGGSLKSCVVLGWAFGRGKRSMAVDDEEAALWFPGGDRFFKSLAKSVVTAGHADRINATFDLK